MVKNLMSKCKGLSLAGWIIAIPIALITLLLLAVGFFEARKAYWDHRVTQMCEKDGGNEVYETVTLTREEHERLGGTKRGLPIPNPAYSSVGEDFPVLREQTLTKIRKHSPEVVKSVTTIKRRSDQKVLGRSVYYWRRGGDFPTGLFHDSSFGCPKDKTALSKRVIHVEGTVK